MKLGPKTWKAISLKQPYASLICSGKKTIETRKWSTKHRGDLVICSSQSPKTEPYGKALCIVELYDIKPMKKGDEKKACINLYPGANSWFLRNLRIIKNPISIKGTLGIYSLKLPEIEL